MLGARNRQGRAPCSWAAPRTPGRDWPRSHRSGRRAWFADPWRQASLRWFDGVQSTGYTHDVEQS